MKATPSADDAEARWYSEAEAAFLELRDWQQAHPDASPRELEAVLDQRLSGLRAQLLEALAPTSPVPPGRGFGESSPQPRRSAILATPLVLGLVVFLIAGIGQSLLPTPAEHTLALVLLAIAAVSGVAVWRKCRDRPLLTAIAGWRQPVDRRPQLQARVAGLGIATLLLAWSVAAYLAEPQAVFGMQGALWLASMVVFVVSCAGWGAADRQSEPEQAWSRGERLGLLGLVVLAVAARILFLEQIPWRFALDEVFAYMESMRYYRGPPISLFTTLWQGTSLPSLWFVVPALLMKVVGPGLAGVRSGVALVSGLAVIPIYLLARLVWGRLAALIAGFTMAISAVYVHYSRVSINNITTALWWALCFYFLLRGLRSRRPIDFAWAGLAAGTSMYTYYGTRLLPLILVAFALYLCVFHFSAFRARIGQFAILGLGFFIGFGPLIGYFIQRPEMWAGRGVKYLNVPTLLPTTWQGWVDNWNILAPLLFRNFLGLSVVPGRDTVYYLPFMLPFEAALVVLGAAVLIWRWRQPASFLVLLWALGVVFTGGTLLDATTIPNFARWAPAFPAFFLALALPLALWFAPIFQSARPALRAAGGVLLAALLVADLAVNAHRYLVRYPPRVPPDASLDALQGRFLGSVGPDARVRVVGQTWVPMRREIAEMMAPNSPVTYFFNPSRQLPVVGDPERDLAFGVYNDMTGYLSVLREYYPDGELRELRPPGGPAIGHAFIVPKAVALERYGVLATFVAGGSGGAVQWTGTVGAVGALPTDSQLSYPVEASWTGAFYQAEGGPALLSLAGADQPSITVLGRPLSIGTPVQLEPGWVPFSVRARLHSPAHLRMSIQSGDDQPVEIDTNRLWPASPEQGLRATLSSSGISYRIDPFLGATLKRPPTQLDPDALPLISMAEGDTRIRWEGQLLTTAGPQTMHLRTDSPVQLTIDGQVVIDECEPSPATRVLIGSLPLAAGWHDVRLDYEASGPKGALEWFWTRPDGTVETVPPSAFRHGRDDRATFPKAPPAIACASEPRPG